MTSNELGKIRQSGVIMNYGPGAIIDFRVPGTGAAVSVISAGLEQWEEQAQQADLKTSDLRRFSDSRLARKLNVEYFRYPPVSPDTPKADEAVSGLIGRRFPTWLQCPRCHSLKPARNWASVPGNPSRSCAPCSEALPGKEKLFVIPVRFVLACRNGHLEDFPWAEWVSHSPGCSNKKDFKLISEGPGLTGLILSCNRCSQKRSLEQIFTREAHDGRKCSGTRPWLPADGMEICTQTPRTMQRGASNLYFPAMESALVIPPWSDDLIRRLGYRWNEIETIVTVEDRQSYINMFWNTISQEIGSIEKEQFIQFVEEKIAESGHNNTGNLRWDEYRQFLQAGSTVSRGSEFLIKSEKVPASLFMLSNLQRVESLKEIRALRSFTRIEPPPGNPPVRPQFLSIYPKKWLPAIEVRGEGIFLAIQPVQLRQWENRTDVMARAGKILNFDESLILNPDHDRELEVTQQLGARFLLLHALAHVLMKQLSLQCGYSSASLRERLYIGDGGKEMAGVLIYTATSDSDGTLGGLQRQGQARRFESTFHEAIRANEWCSSDPLCIKELISATESSSLAACHSCLLAPETSCEEFNRFLDRGMLVGTPENRDLGFFSQLLER